MQYRVGSPHGGVADAVGGWSRGDADEPSKEIIGHADAAIRWQVVPVVARNEGADVGDTLPVELAARLAGFAWGEAEEPAEASRRALELLCEAASCAAGSAVRLRSDRRLEFLAAVGPVADQVRGLVLPPGTGLVGMCADLGVTVRVLDARAGLRHHRAIDASTGFLTQGVLCVPLRTADRRVIGVLQLLNPARGFSAAVVAATEALASRIAPGFAG